MSPMKTGNCLCPLNIILNKGNEQLILTGLTFTNCDGRSPIFFIIINYKPFLFENITIQNNTLDQFETYIGVIDLNDYIGEDSFIIKNSKWINNMLFTQYSSGSGIFIKSKPKLRFEYENCLFEGNHNSKNSF